METRTPPRIRLIIPTLFAIVCVALLVGTYTIFGGTVPLAPQGYRITVPLPDAANLLPGSDVEMAGVAIGKVVSVSRVGNSAETEIQLQTRFAPLHAGATAIARLKTLLGEAYLDLAPGPQSAPPIPDGGRLAASQVTPEVQLDQFLSTFNSGTRANLRGLFGGLAAAIAGQAGSLNDIVGNAAPLSANFDSLITALDSNRSDLQRVIASSGQVLQAVSAREGTLRAAVLAGNDVLSATARRNAALGATMQAFPPFLRDLQSASDVITADSPDLNAAVRALVPVASLATPALRAIDAAAPQFRGLFAALPATLTAGERALPSIQQIVPAAQAGFKQFYPVSRQLIPLLQLVAANPEGPAAAFANVANVTNGTFVGPKGLVQYYATGLPTVWNETVGGWVKRLPTNRMNPYVQPGGLNDIAKLGYVKSFDCRNTTNPLLLPPTGTGAPPCVLQGPWTFNGKSAFYPRLTEAAP
ncbi:MAG TPA: MlaD family protein [Solirubrobacteraceae bacterium]|jgi:virulence factor Mce-like protein|nr:MlaD family protein [Solirubrobacteraceae bacterium]